MPQARTRTETITLPATVPASTPPEPTRPLAYLKTHCDQAFREMLNILHTHQHADQIKHFAVRPLLRLLFQAKRLAKAEVASNNEGPHVSPDIADHLDGLITTLRSMLICPLSRQPLCMPVIDPLAESPYRLAFEASHLARFYQLQATQDSCISTDCYPVNPEARPSEFAPHALVKDLCLWLNTYFPEPTDVPTEAVNQAHPGVMQQLIQWTKSCLQKPVATQPDLATYSLNLAITSGEIANIQCEEAQKKHGEQHIRNQQRLTDTEFQLDEAKLQAEKIIQEETVRLVRDIEKFKAECETRCDELKKSNLSTREQLSQEKVLRTALDQKLQDLQKNARENMGKLKLTKEQLAGVEQRFSELTQQHDSTKQQLKQTQNSLDATTSSYQWASSRMYELERSNAALNSQVSSLSSEVRHESALNREYRADIDNLESRSHSSCAIS